MTEQQRPTSNQLKWACPVCPLSYIRKGDLKVHLLSKHKSRFAEYTAIFKPKSSKEGKRFPCPVEGCPCGYANRRDRKKHILEKHGIQVAHQLPLEEREIKVACFCGKTFSYKSSLHRHIKRHGSLELGYPTEYYQFGYPMESYPLAQQLDFYNYMDLECQNNL